jgi:hypothetical protein
MINYSANQFILGPITPTWINDNFEYGVCTRIKSNGQSGTEPGLCPSPLTCQQRQDKYVCSCGLDQYLDESSNLCCKFLKIMELVIY